MPSLTYANACQSLIGLYSSHQTRLYAAHATGLGADSRGASLAGADLAKFERPQHIQQQIGMLLDRQDGHYTESEHKKDGKTGQN